MITSIKSGFIKHDDYMTPKSAWENIKHLIPKDKVIWEAFYGDGNSGKYLTELDFNVIHKEVDFFENNLGDIIVSNPPFSESKKVIERLSQLVDGKPIEGWKNACAFDCYYYCYKIGLKQDITWLEY